jgi:ParB-like chromosome segregation protein Spo0J
MKTTIVKISNVKSNPNNPRIIKDEKFKTLVKSIQDFPKMLNLRPIIVDKDYIVLGGNMRLRACQEAGLKEVPIVVADELTEKEQREFIIKDNIGFGEWDWELLSNEWDEADLKEWGLDIPTISDVDLDSFFEDIDKPKEEKGKLVLEYTLEDAEKVKLELLKHGKSYEDAVFNLLGL